MKVTIFIMNEEYNDYLEVPEIRNDYFNSELKENGGKYYTRNYRKEAALNCDAVLFKYKGMYIAQAEKSIEFVRGEKSTIKLNSYYKFDPEKIKLNPPIKEEILENLFEPKKDKQFSNFIVERQVKKGKEEQMKNFLELYKNPYLESIYWNNFANELKLNNLLKEINLYNFENIHTAFFSNFIKENNIYNLGNKPLKFFLELLKEKNKNVPDINVEKFNVYYQKRYPIDSKKSIIPDITIDITDKNKEKYRIILEAKVTAEENRYKEDEMEIKQCQKYRDFFEKQKKEGNTEYKYIYVFLAFKEHYVKNYINITFKDIANKIYDLNKYENFKYKEILKDYLKTFHDLCDCKYKFDIATIPNVFWNSEEELNKMYKQLKQDIEDISSYKKSRKY